MKMEKYFLDPKAEGMQAKGIAYYRLPKEVKDFFLLCERKDGIVGFTWDSNEPWNLGIILKESKS